MRTDEFKGEYSDKDGEGMVEKIVKVVKLLLAENSVDPDFKDNNGRTPLSYAASNGQEAVVKLLLEKGAELQTVQTVNKIYRIYHWECRNIS